MTNDVVAWPNSNIDKEDRINVRIWPSEGFSKNNHCLKICVKKVTLEIAQQCRYYYLLLGCSLWFLWYAVSKRGGSINAANVEKG